jgi:hypothetical protein
MTITDSGRLSEQEMAKARELYASGVRSKDGLRKGLGVAWAKAVEAHTRLTAEDDERRRQQVEERRSRLVKLRPRKSRASRLPVRRTPLPEAPVSPAVEAVPELLSPTAEMVPVEVPTPDSVAVPASTGGAGSVKPTTIVALVLSISAAAVIGVSAPALLALSGRAAVAAAAVAVLALVGAVWSTATLARALVAGRTARDVALDLASWAVAAVAGFLAAYGQVKFAEWAGVTGWEKWLVPGILEPAVVVLLLLANRRVKRRRAGFPAKPIGKLLALAALLGGFAVYTNVVHTGGKAGLVFGAATVVGLILWWVKLQDDAAPDDWDDAPQSKRLSRKTSRYRLLRWLILFPQTRRAWLISLDHSISDAEVGLDLARRWRRSFDESRDAGESRRKARRDASVQVDKYLLNEKES